MNMLVFHILTRLLLTLENVPKHDEKKNNQKFEDETLRNTVYRKADIQGKLQNMLGWSLQLRNCSKTYFDHVVVTPHTSKHPEAYPTTTVILKEHSMHRTMVSIKCVKQKTATSDPHGQNITNRNSSLHIQNTSTDCFLLFCFFHQVTGNCNKMVL